MFLPTQKTLSECVRTLGPKTSAEIGFCRLWFHGGPVEKPTDVSVFWESSVMHGASAFSGFSISCDPWCPFFYKISSEK